MVSLIPDYQPPFNSTLLSIITPTHVELPFYQPRGDSILSFISDRYLSIFAPVIAYWVTSILFHLIDTLKLPYFEKRRIHESPEVLSRNKATISEVIRAVVIQHLVQISLALFWIDDDEKILRTEVYRDHLADMAQMAPKVATLVFLLAGKRSGEELLRSHGAAIVQWMYWWGLPLARLFFSFFVIDTWEYALHRLCHTSTYLYRKFHSVHHRLYVPYAFGALYNHPVEGFFFDSLGGAVAHALSGMTTRGACLMFTISSIKTVDDHCGYRLWWDPCQFLFANNADWHDIHHQAYGIKSNFAQPFFTNWDRLLGTSMTREQAEKRTRRPVKVE